MDQPSRISLVGHAGWLMVVALGVAFLASGASGRFAEIAVKLEWSAFAVYAILSSASFQLSRRSLWRYAAVQLAAAVLSLGFIVALVLGGRVRGL